MSETLEYMRVCWLCGVTEEDAEITRKHAGDESMDLCEICEIEQPEDFRRE